MNDSSNIHYEEREFQGEGLELTDKEIIPQCARTVGDVSGQGL